MGTVTFDTLHKKLTIQSILFFYGDLASEEVAKKVVHDIASHWNQPETNLYIKDQFYQVVFDIEGHYAPNLTPADVIHNENPAYNFFRIEEQTNMDVSFVDGVGSNTGYFKLQNLFQTGTTAAHEYGHTIGLDHPQNMDIRGMGIPGIMYPRGTITDPEFLYNPSAIPGDNTNGGTMNPEHRQVTHNDIQLLNLHLHESDKDQKTIIGQFTNLWHEKAIHHSWIS